MTKAVAGAEADGRGRTIRRVAAVLVGVLAALVVTDVALRMAGFGPAPVVKRRLHRPDDPRVWFHCYTSNEGGHFIRIPEPADDTWRLEKLTEPPQELPIAQLAETPWGVRYDVDDNGVRGPTIAARPAEDTLRVAGVGDSFALGEGVPFDRTLFAQLERDLRAEGLSVEIPNLGRSGVDLRHAVDVVARVADDLGASRAIVVITPNDVPLSPQIRARVAKLTGELVPDEDTRPLWARVSTLAHVLRSASIQKRASTAMIATYRDAYDPEQNEVGLASLAGRLRRLASITTCRSVIVVYPLLVELDDYPLDVVGERIAELCEAAGLPVLDLTPSFRGRDAEALHVHKSDQHPNGDAHAVAAAAIAEWVRAEHPDFLDPDSE